LVRCSDGSIYCGITNHLKNRMAAHNSGKGAKYTKPRRPVLLLGVSSGMTKSDALKLEYRVKRVPAGKKLSELAKGKGAVTDNAHAELTAIKKKLRRISKRVERMNLVLRKLERHSLLENIRP
jgi:putative endonuclease